MANPLALIVDDEPDIRELLEITLGRMKIDTESADSLDQAYQHLNHKTFDLCLTDMNLPDGNGIDLVKYIQQKYSKTPVAMITAYGNMDTAITALKAGAFDFVSKPVDLQRLRDLVSSALKLNKPHHDTKKTTSEIKLLGESKAIKQLRKQVIKLARSQAPVYISGESGSGKELVARLIHDEGPRVDAPFIPVNCGAIPTELMESEFFGHKKGSFTGAVNDKPGLFQAADNGTLFLDEVADLPMSMQVKLLRAIQEKSIRPVGTETEIKVDVRILSATHKDLSQLVNEGSFRQDLFYRINVIELKVPPLRDRSEDIPLLSEHFLQKIANSCDLDPPKLSNEALTTLKNYPFPGNVRELENTLERAFTLCEEDLIKKDDLRLSDIDSNSLLTIQDKSLPVEGVSSLEDYLEDLERKAIVQALEETRWNKTAAAKKLGITFRALRYRLKKLDLE
ncbi:sigma-54-dependent Fis family transcriptional regulator [Endozoicomonas sp. SM1973]|uniref:Sigma-54-dependent Fis family transcriptional regulator n=1 Tax=Spartinivicinus marinus TaxID=2994442 RepID=A0A853ICS4_9GAMM|nr:sigma-54 dependent transcriptional regulator [Spartinivicinus marinus]MCX4025585.1 sigma-54 dependent transcriptional regulator [Spartinivicinus marinus]NYZ65186.1 sigma-54-dependent Fis family transcriptional regulator [Spartinivicinus marinus]